MTTGQGPHTASIPPHTTLTAASAAKNASVLLPQVLHKISSWCILRAVMELLEFYWQVPLEQGPLGVLRFRDAFGGS